MANRENNSVAPENEAAAASALAYAQDYLRGTRDVIQSGQLPTSARVEEAMGRFPKGSVVDPVTSEPIPYRLDEVTLQGNPSEVTSASLSESSLNTSVPLPKEATVYTPAERTSKQ